MAFERTSPSRSKYFMHPNEGLQFESSKLFFQYYLNKRVITERSSGQSVIRFIVIIASNSKNLELSKYTSNSNVGEVTLTYHVIILLRPVLRLCPWSPDRQENQLFLANTLVILVGCLKNSISITMQFVLFGELISPQENIKGANYLWTWFLFLS